MRTYRSNPMPTNSSQSRTSPAPPTPVAVPPRGETLLVVDDDPMIRDLEAQILRLKGYTVLQAEGAEDAMRLAGEIEPIHLLITDFAMPDVDGLELSHRFRSVHPKAPVLMVSSSLPLLGDGARDLKGVELLAKPFAFSQLLHKVRTLLDAAEVVPTRRPWCRD